MGYSQPGFVTEEKARNWEFLEGQLNIADLGHRVGASAAAGASGVVVVDMSARRVEDSADRIGAAVGSFVLWAGVAGMIEANVESRHYLELLWCSHYWQGRRTSLGEVVVNQSVAASAPDASHLTTGRIVVGRRLALHFPSGQHYAACWWDGRLLDTVQAVRSLGRSRSRLLLGSMWHLCYTPYCLNDRRITLRSLIRCQSRQQSQAQLL